MLHVAVESNEKDCQFCSPKTVLTEPPWNLYVGDNHTPVVSTAKHHSVISFMEHIGGPLSWRLWHQLAHVLRVDGIRIYQSGDAEWTDAPIGSRAHIYMSGGLIVDIALHV